MRARKGIGRWFMGGLGMKEVFVGGMLSCVRGTDRSSSSSSSTPPLSPTFFPKHTTTTHPHPYPLPQPHQSPVATQHARPQVGSRRRHGVWWLVDLVGWSAAVLCVWDGMGWDAGGREYLACERRRERTRTTKNAHDDRPMLLVCRSIDRSTEPSRGDELCDARMDNACMVQQH